MLLLAQRQRENESRRVVQSAFRRLRNRRRLQTRYCVVLLLLLLTSTLTNYSTVSCTVWIRLPSNIVCIASSPHISTNFSVSSSVQINTTCHVTFDLTRMMIMRMRRTVENGSAFTLGARTVPERSRTVELTVLFRTVQNGTLAFTLRWERFQSCQNGSRSASVNVVLEKI